MRSSYLILIFGILFILLTDTALFFQIKGTLRNKKKRFFYWFHSFLFVIGLLLYHWFTPRIKGPESYYWIGTGIGILFLFYGPKLIFIVLYAIGRAIIGIGKWKKQKVVMRMAGITASICFLILLYSITWGRYAYKTETTRICFPQLPAAFNHFKIVQLSDLHLGSHTSRYKGIPKLVEQVNALHPDVILFTGDMVNNFASELLPWIPQLKRLQAKYGKFAVTGNHDYGNYTRWRTKEAREENLRNFYRNMEEAGFKMLNNTHLPLVQGKDTLYLAGVENWGNPPFPRYGDLSLAIEGIQEHFIILLSHDPSHWRSEVLQYNIPLTLSGHTHAMQLGFQIGSYKWSPARYLYPEYDGLYKKNKKYLHVSRGEGYLGFPGRIGLRPRIDEIILVQDCKE